MIVLCIVLQGFIFAILFKAVWLLDTLTRSGRRIIGFDVVEVCPAPDERIDAITGARMLWKLCGQTLKSNES